MSPHCSLYIVFLAGASHWELELTHCSWENNLIDASIWTVAVYREAPLGVVQFTRFIMISLLGPLLDFSVDMWTLSSSSEGKSTACEEPGDKCSTLSCTYYKNTAVKQDSLPNIRELSNQFKFKYELPYFSMKYNYKYHNKFKIPIDNLIYFTPRKWCL